MTSSNQRKQADETQKTTTPAIGEVYLGNLGNQSIVYVFDAYGPGHAINLDDGQPVKVEFSNLSSTKLLYREGNINSVVQSCLMSRQDQLIYCIVSSPQIVGEDESWLVTIKKINPFDGNIQVKWSYVEDDPFGFSVKKYEIHNSGIAVINAEYVGGECSSAKPALFVIDLNTGQFKQIPMASEFQYLTDGKFSYKKFIPYTTSCYPESPVCYNGKTSFCKTSSVIFTDVIQ